MVIGIGYAELSAAALLEFITRAARARIVSTSLSCFTCCTIRQLSPTPVIVDRHNAAGQERRCFGRNAVFLLRLEAEQRFAILVAAQRKNRKDEIGAVLRSEQPLPFCCAEAHALH